MQQVTAYQTSDGKVFADIKSAEAHEAAINCGNLINEFLLEEMPERTDRWRNSVARYILNWEVFKARTAASDAS